MQNSLSDEDMKQQQYYEIAISSSITKIEIQNLLPLRTRFYLEQSRTAAAQQREAR